MKIIYFSIYLSALILQGSFISYAQLKKIDPGHYDTTWWNRAPVRLIQTNLREIDAEMDTDAFVQSILDASANVVLLNVGGIVANYPTKLKYHYLNPYLKGDLVGSLIQKLHAKNIRIIGRYDFSKINETLAAQKPDWLYIGTDGKTVNFNGQVHTCINGGYQQEYIFDILKEAITNYPLDGLFFNMIGYTTKDYADVNHGICQCVNCKKRFKETTGLVLPLKADMNDPVFRQYNAFKTSTSEQLFNQIGSFIKKLNPNLIINTYTDAGVDMIRSESSSWLTDEYEWNYFSTDHVKRVLGSYNDRTPSNLLQYFLAIGYRHIATSPNISRTWVLENMLNGAPLDVYVIGTLVNQEDNRFIPIMNDLYRFHKTNEKLFTNLQSISNIALVRGSTDEYKGLIKLLSEEHIMFDVIEATAIGSVRTPKKLADYDALILGDISNMDNAFIATIDQYVQDGGKLLSTGSTSVNDGIGTPMNVIRLKCLGVSPDYEFFSQAKSTYLKVREKDKVTLGQKECKDFDLIMMYSDMLKCKPVDKAQAYLNLVPATRFGPPEKSYYTESDITAVPGLIANSYGQGKSVFFPWQIGAQYNFKGNYAHRTLFLAALQNLLGVKKQIETDASPLIEMTWLANRNSAFEWIGMNNLSGQIGASFREPVVIRNTMVRFKPLHLVSKIKLMRSGEQLHFKQTNGWVECTVPAVGDFELMLCTYK